MSNLRDCAMNFVLGSNFPTRVVWLVTVYSFAHDQRHVTSLLLTTLNKSAHCRLCSETGTWCGHHKLGETTSPLLGWWQLYSSKESNSKIWKHAGIFSASSLYQEILGTLPLKWRASSTLSLLGLYCFLHHPKDWGSLLTTMACDDHEVLLTVLQWNCSEFRKQRRPWHSSAADLRWFHNFFLVKAKGNHSGQWDAKVLVPRHFSDLDGF